MGRQRNHFHLHGNHSRLSESNLHEKAGCLYQKEPRQCGEKEAKLSFPKPKKFLVSNYKATKFDKRKTFQDPAPQSKRANFIYKWYA
jgi:hypothetical protein